MNRFSFSILLSLIACPCILAQQWPDVDRFRVSREGTALVADAVQVTGALNSRLTGLEWRKIDRRASAERPRGAESVAVYEKCSPAIVYVTDGETGHGTGFFVRDGGWIITNNHVVDALPYEPSTGVRVARIVTGRLADDGAMSANEGFLEADVYRTDEIRDLALLRVRSGDKAFRNKSIPVAQQSPRPGSLCIAIGHPAQGVMWTIREGEVSGRGEFPRDQIGDFFMKGTDSAVRDELDTLIASMPSRKVLLSSCGLNPGDSGGPLLNGKGEVIAVSFAVPGLDGQLGLDLGKFSYHVHLDELAKFMADWPDRPDISPPSPLPPASLQCLVDLDENGRNDCWTFLVSGDEMPTGLFMDLDGDSDDSVATSDNPEDLLGKSPDTDWDAECVFIKLPCDAVFLDRDNDSTLDLVLVPGAAAMARFDRASDGTWQPSKWSGDLATGDFFESKSLNKSFRFFLQRLAGGN